MGLWAVSATVLLALVSAPSACAAESAANDVHLTKAAVSDSQRFVFLAGLEGCGHHYWASAFKNIFMDLDDVRHVPWSGTSSRSAAWTRCASFGSGALDESATTCLQHIVGDNSTLFVKGHEYSNSLVSSYAASLRLFSGRPSHTRLLDETAAAEAAALVPVTGRARTAASPDDGNDVAGAAASPNLLARAFSTASDASSGSTVCVAHPASCAASRNAAATAFAVSRLPPALSSPPSGLEVPSPRREALLCWRASQLARAEPAGVFSTSWKCIPYAKPPSRNISGIFPRSTETFVISSGMGGLLMASVSPYGE